MTNTKPVTLALVGAGLRGTHYARLAVATGNVRIAAVAEPDPVRRERAAAEFGVPADSSYDGWESLAGVPKVADAVIIATQDNEHTKPAIRFAELGYHLLLEKPMAPTEDEARQIVTAAERAGVMLAVCHVLRYTEQTRIIKQLIEGGAVGQVMNVQHLEPIGWWHFAHSYVRGNWRRAADSSSMLLAKACHDLDWLAYVLGRPAIKVSSFGGLTHFRPENKPADAAGNCLDCPVENTCPYSAPRLYLGCLGDTAREHWPLGAVTSTPTRSAVLDALRNGPYGRCAYDCDNDVADQQVVTIEYEGGTTATVTVVAFSVLGHRKTRIFGTHGSIESDGDTIVTHDFVTDARQVLPVNPTGASAADGHGGGDERLIEAFVAALVHNDPALILTDARSSLASHQLAWAAETSRHHNQVTSLRQ
ncbi:oxidoreductase family protein [Kribbella voronezhensis]|uniref:Oxidoreductase family protein n=1 Tax=Kribbella voronezhensis TaxID=2512212 RepID=A0A4R7TA88_9ACTN|nr:Gfo/Idh/MocA family oxidoreductase [Kribbella voronezhensis]TDU88845.1 oxidoreductase family protein [Kribbella voronezhensis]